jgi:2-polyprenyl-3-methyl-5-hydroxy-6-metoxy-1,4-benzoquinol methylase
VGRCALCGSPDRDIVQTQSLALLNRDQACKIDFCACRACGHLQQSPPVTPELMAHHYRSFAAYEEFGDAEGLRAAPPSRHAQRFLTLVACLDVAPGQAYEVGCASGAMLHQFRKQGWRVGGCDLSPSAISQAKDIYGITAALGSEEQTLPAQSNLDLILVCHVLEHLYDPLAALARFHAALAPRGHLVLEVPCAIAAEVLPPGWFTFEHLHYYQPATLEWLLRKTGFEIVETRIDMTCQHYPVIAIAARKGTDRVAACPDPSAGLSLARSYAARDKLLWTATALRLARVQEPVFVYGAGIHTAQLLDRTAIGSKIIAIADRDSKKWGQSQAGKTVISPAELLAHPSRAPVVISSYVSEKRIMAALLEGGIAPSRLIPLYSQVPAPQAEEFSADHRRRVSAT